MTDLNHLVSSVKMGVCSLDEALKLAYNMGACDEAKKQAEFREVLKA